MKLDVDLLKEHIEYAMEVAEKGENVSCAMKSYEKAISFREKRFTLGDIILKMSKTVDDGGFLVPVTNIRKAVNAMTDEELAEILAPSFTIGTDGRLHDCDCMSCSLSCPVYDSTEECVDSTKDYMLKEAE